MENEAERYHRLMQEPDTVFVFGSNLMGIHGAGAALEARTWYGAVTGNGRGRMGRSYAIPTKGHGLSVVLSLVEINSHVAEFLVHAAFNDDNTFVVTRVGCGLAGYSDGDIAPMFRHAPRNCILPEQWNRRYETPALLGYFTWEDVDTLRELARGVGTYPTSVTEPEDAKPLLALADKLEALLPPREKEGKK